MCKNIFTIIITIYTRFSLLILDKRYVFKNEGTTNSEMRKTFTKSQIIMEEEEMKEEKEIVRDRRSINKDLSRSYRGNSGSGKKTDKKYYRRNLEK